MHSENFGRPSAPSCCAPSGKTTSRGVFVRYRSMMKIFECWAASKKNSSVYRLNTRHNRHLRLTGPDDTTRYAHDASRTQNHEGEVDDKFHGHQPLLGIWSAPHIRSFRPDNRLTTSFRAQPICQHIEKSSRSHHHHRCTRVPRSADPLSYVSQLLARTGLKSLKTPLRAVRYKDSV